MIKKWAVIFISIYQISINVYSQNYSGTVKNAQYYIGRPYVAHTLEANDKEKLIIDTIHVDCTTFVEYVLAKSLFESNQNHPMNFVDYVKLLRYRNGIINGYTSRLHYITEWIDNAVKYDLIEDITSLYSSNTQKINISYMSNNPQYYKHLNNIDNLNKIKEIEHSITNKIIHWIPKDSMKLNGLSYINDGDVIAITTNIKGLDVVHLGFAIYKEDGSLGLLHASSKHKKVLIDPLPLSTLLNDNRRWSGIRVLRMKTH